jgi:hypothetical protein
MRNTIIIIGFAAIALFSACNTKGVPTEFSNACGADNEKKVIEVSGVIAERGSSVYCSNRGGRMECGFALLEAPASEKKFSVDIEQGTGANTVDELGKGYKKEDIKIRDNDGNQIELGKDTVKVTGKMSVEPKMNVCFMQVYRIER